MANETNPIVVHVDRNNGRVLVPVNITTIQAYDEFDDLLSSEGTEALQEKWSTLTNHLREHLQIQDPRTPRPDTGEPSLRPPD